MYPYDSSLEMGGFYGEEAIADQQDGPTCAFEAVENVAELYHGKRADAISSVLIPLAQLRGLSTWSPAGFALKYEGIQPLLAQLRIPTEWHYFNQQVLVDALHANRVGLVVVDAHLLNARMYPFPNSWHAITITNYITDPAMRVVEGYRGIDSNTAVRRTHNWRAENLERAATAAQVLGPTLLVTSVPAQWAQQGVFYRRNEAGKIVLAR